MHRALFTVAALALTATFARAADSYRTYTNARFGFVALYPSNLLSSRPESDNGDGRKFVSRDGKIELTTFAATNINDATLSQMQTRALADWKSDKARLTYVKSGPQWFALSGYVGDAIFYEKTVNWNGVFHTMIWRYPKSLKARLDAPVSRTVRAFDARNFVRPTFKSADEPRSQTRKAPALTPTPNSKGY